MDAPKGKLWRIQNTKSRLFAQYGLYETCETFLRRVRDAHVKLFAVLRNKAKRRINNLRCRRPRNGFSIFDTAFDHFR